MKKCTEFSFILKPSKRGGIGVFAIHTISAGTQVFSGNLPTRTLEWEKVPVDFHKYCIAINDDECIAPMRFDRLDICWFVNHSFSPNIIKKDSNYVALRNIKADEEILVDYNELNEPEHLKESYFRKRSRKKSKKYKA